MEGYPNPIHALARQYRAEKARQLGGDVELQSEKQRLACLKHEQAEKEKADYLASLEIKPSSPPSTSTSGSGRIAKFIPKTKPKPRVSRVASARQTQQTTKGETKQ